MRILFLAVLLSGCGSACSSSMESAPDPANATGAKGAEPTPSGDDPSSAAPKAPEEPTPPPPPPEPVDPQDERVVYANDKARTRTRFAALDDLILVADLREVSEPGERLSLQDAFGRARWSHDYARIDDLALDGDGAFATADGHLYAYDLESGEPADLGEARGDLVLTPSHVYVHSLGAVKRVPREGGAAQKVVAHPTPGFHRIAVGDGKLVMLASAYRNRPARFPKLGALLVAPAKGGKLRERFTAMYSPGPLLELDSGYAYFGSSAKGEEGFEYRIVRVPLEGRPEARPVVHHPIAVFAVEGDHIFAAARLNEQPGLYAFSTGEADPVLLSAFDGGASKVALSESYVYWESRGRLYRVDKALPELAVAEPKENEAADSETTQVKAAPKKAPAKQPPSAKPKATAPKKPAATGD